jgi:SAM-dependent methyltransferase
MLRPFARGLRRLVSRPHEPAASPSPDSSLIANAPPGQLEDARAVAEAFLIVLRRVVEPLELRDELRGFRATTRPGLVVRLLSSPEFRRLHAAWTGGREIERDLDAEEAALGTIGPHERFVDLAYQDLLGRPVDAEGGRHLVAALAGGLPRRDALRSLATSEEFMRRYRALSPQGGVIPRDTQLCELANPAKWDNPEWLRYLRELTIADDKASMHRKGYEFAQLLYGMERLGQLRPEASVLSVGAGHEHVLYWLANHVGRVVATDLYEGVWQDVQAQEGDAGVLRRPEAYAPFPYRTDRLTFLKMDGRRLAFRSETFDVAYSLSSIEHFGGLDGACDTLDEMARVLKPGGLIAIATEYVLSGPPHDETFQPRELAALIDRPGLRLVQPIDDRVYDRYEYAAIDLYANPYQTPHMVVRFDDTVFTTVMVFLQKR